MSAGFDKQQAGWGRSIDRGESVVVVVVIGYAWGWGKRGGVIDKRAWTPNR